MAVDDGQENPLSGSRALTVNKPASRKQSNNNSRSRSRSSNNANRRGMIPSEAQQRVMSDTLGGGIIRIALSPSSTPRESPFGSPKPSRTNINTTNSTTPGPAPSVAARDASNKNATKESVANILPNTTYNSSTKKNNPTPSQYSPSIYNGGDDWTKAPSPPLPVPAMPLPTLAATTYSPRSARRNQANLNSTNKSKSKGATRNPPKKLAIKDRDYNPELEPKPLSTPRINRQGMKIDPRDEKDRKEKPLPARPDPSQMARKKTIRDISVPVSPATTAQPAGNLGTATALGTTVVRGQPGQSIQATKMVKIKTKQVARRQPQVIQAQEPSSATATGTSNTRKAATLARTKSRITRIMSFGGTPAPVSAVNSGSDEGAGGGWWDMLDNVLLGPLKPPPRPTAVTQPASTKKVPEMRTIAGGGLEGSTMSSKQGVFDPKNLI
ncbi:hypothetical protein V8F20_010565 [Naviculisporaceae sp. PSN 640]